MTFSEEALPVPDDELSEETRQRYSEEEQGCRDDDGRYDSCVGTTRRIEPGAFASTLPLSVLEIGVRPFNILARAGIETVGMLAALEEPELLTAHLKVIAFRQYRVKDAVALLEARDLARKEIQDAITRDERARGIEPGA